MKKIAFILSCIMIIALIPVISIGAEPIDETPKAISTAAEFEAISGVPGNYYLTGNIDFAGKVYDRCILESFNGTLDGKGFKLYNFSLNYTEGTADSSLILKLGAEVDTTVKNLNIGDATTPIVYSFVNNNKSHSPFASVTGNNDPGTNIVIENVHIYANVTNTYAEPGHKGNNAGFVAYACKKGTLTFNDCSFNGFFKSGEESEGTVWRNVGGYISAANTPEITFNNCVNNAEILQGPSTTEARASGFIAYLAAGKTATFNNCTNNGKITVLGADSEAQAAGFVSDAQGTTVINKSTNNGEISGKYFTGGFIAYVQADGCQINDCKNTGKIDAEAVSFSATHGFATFDPVIANFTDTAGTPVTDTTVADTTEAPAPEDTPAPDTTAEEAPVETPEATNSSAPETTKAPEEKGCGGMIAGGAVLVAILGTALIIKKRD